MRWLRRVVQVEEGERRALLWSFLYFLCLLTSYYVLRSVRDERGIAAGVGKLPWLFTATFLVLLAVAPLWSVLVSRVPRARLLPVLYRFFWLNLVAFYLVFRLRPGSLVVGYVFFVWASVFSLMGVAVFWSFMADLFREDQGKRLFGFIAAGGSAGAILGPLATSLVVHDIGPINLLLVSAVLLEGAALCVGRLVRWRAAETTSDAAATTSRPVEGGAWSGILVVFSSPYLRSIALYTMLSVTLGSVGYFVQAHLMVNEPSLDQTGRTALFAKMDLAANTITVALQALVLARLLRWPGVGVVLTLAPLLAAGTFLAQALAPAASALTVSTVTQVLRRALAFGIIVPAGHVLFTVVAPEQKYKSKAFIDTVVYRAGDMASTWGVAKLMAVGLGVAGLAAGAALPLCLGWMVVGWIIGRRHRALVR